MQEKLMKFLDANYVDEDKEELIKYLNDNFSEFASYKEAENEYIKSLAEMKQKLDELQAINDKLRKEYRDTFFKKEIIEDKEDEEDKEEVKEITSFDEIFEER